MFCLLIALMSCEYSTTKPPYECIVNYHDHLQTFLSTRYHIAKTKPFLPFPSFTGVVFLCGSGDLMFSVNLVT